MRLRPPSPVWTAHRAGANLNAALRPKSTEVALDFCLSLPHPGGMANDSKVIAANAAFYAAFSTGDFDEMQRMWADDDAISCIHPGWPAIIGRATVIGSWRDILQTRSGRRSSAPSRRRSSMATARGCSASRSSTAPPWPPRTIFVVSATTGAWCTTSPARSRRLSNRPRTIERVTASTDRSDHVGVIYCAWGCSSVFYLAAPSSDRSSSTTRAAVKSSSPKNMLRVIQTGMPAREAATRPLAESSIATQSAAPSFSRTRISR
ncbi:hypothetical protein ABIF91_001167 [Bradyrhizobium sp. USDA 241]